MRRASGLIIDLNCPRFHGAVELDIVVCSIIRFDIYEAVGNALKRRLGWCCIIELFGCSTTRETEKRPRVHSCVCEDGQILGERFACSRVGDLFMLFTYSFIGAVSRIIIIIICLIVIQNIKI